MILDFPKKLVSRAFQPNQEQAYQVSIITIPEDNAKN
jgi:hypothetical protein